WYFRPGLTWVRRTHRLCVRVLPRGSIFSGGAQAIFAKGSETDDILALLALVNSRPFDFLTKVAVGRTGDAVQFEPGMLDRTPVPQDATSTRHLCELGRRAWSLCWAQDRTREPSPSFVLPSLLTTAGQSLAVRADGWAARVRAVEAELAEIQAE